MEKFVIVDGNSLINRAYYALPMLKSLKGEPCNAIYGFINMILNLIIKEQPKYFVCVFDAGKHTFRHDMYEEYKGTRDKMPEDLAHQLPGLKKLLNLMKIKTIEIPEIEADDIIGSLSRKFDEEFILLSGDKDLLQLINDNTTVWLTQRGITDTLKVDEPTLMQEFGLKPYQVVELKSIMGDSSDNIPGVAGIGKVGGMALIKEYDTLANIYKNIDTVPEKYKKKLLSNKDMAQLSHKLATIKLDVDLNVTKQDCLLTLPFDFATYEFMRELDFRSILNRKELFDNTNKQKYEEKQIDLLKTTDVNVIEVDSDAKFLEMLASIENSLAIYDTEMIMHIATEDTEYLIYKNGQVFNNNLHELKNLFEGDKQKICFDAKSLMHELRHYDIKLNNYFDVSIAIYIANELDAEITLDDALKLNDLITDNKANALFLLKSTYITKLINNTQLKLYSDIELPLVEVLYEMECAGIKIDTDQIRSMSQVYHRELADIIKSIYELAGEEFNLNSPKQLQSILFEKLAIEYKGKKGTSVEVLTEIQDKHPIVPLIIRYRKVSKLISTYLDGMLNYIGDDIKIHTKFMQRTTSTGRLSSREPNLQNLPIRDDEGRALRKMFSSSFENGKLVSADYNQIELRLMANFSQDQNMIQDYLSGKDIHTATASKIFDVPIDQVTSYMRRTAKSVNFGIIYGISPFGLAQNIHSTQKEASEFIKKYMDIYPKIKEYGKKCIQDARDNGYATTIMGRKRHIPDINSGNHVVRGFAERVAKNMPLQGSASDIIKIAMIKVYGRIKALNLKSKLVLQIHDELVVDCHPSEVDIIKDILKQEMESVIDLQVPLLVEVGVGDTLFDAK